MDYTQEALVPNCPDTSAPVGWCRNVLGPKCLDTTHLTQCEYTISKLYKLVDIEYVDADCTFLGWCVAGADGTPVRGLYGPLKTDRFGHTPVICVVDKIIIIKRTLSYRFIVHVSFSKYVDLKQLNRTALNLVVNKHKTWR